MSDVNMLRDPAIALHGLIKADDAYTLYYDETNNIRRLHVRANGLNEREPKCFVIAGVAHRGPPRPISLEGLRSELRIQASAKEIKLKHIATGSFLEALASPKMEAFLAWLSAQDLYLHFTVLDPLYWSIVDIIDSILAEAGQNALLPWNQALKNDLYTVLRHDYETTVDMFQRYTYPDVGRTRRREFVTELLDLLTHRANLLPPLRRNMLKGVLQIAARLDALPFLEDETPNVLIEGFGPFYLERIAMLKNSTHVLDDEYGIEAYLSGLGLTDGIRPLANYRFATSHDEPGIQLSDVIAGLLGKFFTYVCVTAGEELVQDRQNLSAQQIGTLERWAALTEQSVEENAVFAHYLLSERDRHGAAFFLDRTGS
ncbi:MULTISPECIES: DUF3800 domain-containing protein [Mesorhizobium]|uniref:DUF3800 domain-containing protein n=1 Tax=Mesorhizobium TaxID=68287 RepID=UPI0010A95F97|nr:MULTISPECIES: DUF3800 domain-containing protein [Mesorhizobium]